MGTFIFSNILFETHLSFSIFHSFNFFSNFSFSSNNHKRINKPSLSLNFAKTLASICLTLSLVIQNSFAISSKVYFGQSIHHLILIIFVSLSSSIDNISSNFSFKIIISTYSSGFLVLLSTKKSPTVFFPSSPI
jgi:hypothetical protein